MRKEKKERKNIVRAKKVKQINHFTSPSSKARKIVDFIPKFPLHNSPMLNVGEIWDTKVSLTYLRPKSQTNPLTPFPHEPTFFSETREVCLKYFFFQLS